MTIEEYEQKINHTVLNQDEIPVIMQEILKELKTDLTTLESLKGKITEQETQIKGLQESNVKLFLGQTGKNPTQPPESKPDIEDLQGMEAVNAYLDQAGITDSILNDKEEK